MKLRTRIALIAGAVIFLFTMISDVAIFRICRRTLLDQALSEGVQESREIFNAFDEYIGQMDSTLSREQVDSFFKSRRDDYTIVLRGDRRIKEEWYNKTILTPEILAEQNDHFVENFYYFSYFAAGRRLLIYHGGSRSNFSLYHICDVTDVYLRIYSLGLEMALISLGVVTAAFLVMFFIVRQSLLPLQSLSDGARSIAAGAYDRRVQEKRKDEIGSLGRDFNRMAEAIEGHIREVEESEEKKTLFMGSLTHELKTPLTAISGYAQTIRSVKLPENDRDEALRYIHEESRRLDRLSKKMMRLLELEENAELLFETVSVRDLFEGAVRTCAAAAKEKGVILEIGDCPGEVKADKDLMTEVLVNLIDNAVKASNQGDTVQLYTEHGCIVVEDNGCGIPSEEIHRITEPFYMVDKSRSRKSGGAGLGLALTAMILKRHGMALSVESEIGQGTKISIFTIS
ncbi:MAG: HAMP domain-containing histidine kinase [Acutalibacter sp.]|nr:HAMP domain-containing histidine kinase [Acutalibacter sp.]